MWGEWTSWHRLLPYLGHVHPFGREQPLILAIWHQSFNQKDELKSGYPNTGVLVRQAFRRFPGIPSGVHLSIGNYYLWLSLSYLMWVGQTTHGDILRSQQNLALSTYNRRPSLKMNGALSGWMEQVNFALFTLSLG